VAFFRDHTAACETALAVHQRNLALESLEIVSPNSAAMFDGLRLKQKGWALLLAAAGVNGAVERSLKEAAKVCKGRAKGSVERLEGESAERLWQNVRAFLSPSKNGDALLAKAALLPSQAEAFLGELEALAGRRGLKMQSVAHAGTGSVHSLWQAGKRDLAQDGDGLVAELRKAASRLGAPVVIEGCPEPLKGRIDIWGEPRGDFPLMRNIKGQLDPKGTLSPGRFLGRM
jgi:FAD/FMN-containing dehydrogenase